MSQISKITTRWRHQTYLREGNKSQSIQEAEATLRRQRRMLKNSMVKHMVTGARVVRGLDWKWRDQVRIYFFM